MEENQLGKMLPLTEATYCILLSLTNPLHGYGIMQKVAAFSKGRITLGAGTLYGALGKLEKNGFIRKAGRDGRDGRDRKKEYLVTNEGITLLLLEHERHEMMVKNGREILKDYIGGKNE